VNERQRDLFLWQWSRRRQRGLSTVALRGAVIGAIGGVLFAAILFSGSGPENGSTASLLVFLQRAGLMLALSVPAFAWIGYTGARRVFSANEAMYQSMLQSGADVPEQPPQLRAGDRGPMIAVIATVISIVVFIGFLTIQYG
jgi:hypothetical protein